MQKILIQHMNNALHKARLPLVPNNWSPSHTYISKWDYKWADSTDTCPYSMVKTTDTLTYLLIVLPEEYKTLREKQPYDIEIRASEEILYVHKSKIRDFTRNKVFKLLCDPNDYYSVLIPELNDTPQLYLPFTTNIKFVQNNMTLNIPQMILPNDCNDITEFMLTGLVAIGNCILKPLDFDYAKYKDIPSFPEESFDPHHDTELEECKGYFGNTYNHNVRLAKLASTFIPDRINNSLKVSKGDAIAIIYMGAYNWKPYRNIKVYTPYHVVPVIDADDTSFITLEADANNNSRKYPIWDIYSQNPYSGNTFYDRYVKDYTLQKPHKIHKKIPDTLPIALTLTVDTQRVKQLQNEN